MPSVYSKISKINKQKLDKIESELFVIKSDIRKIEKEVQDIYGFIAALIIPQNGAMEQLNAYQERRRLLNTQKDRQQNALHVKHLELSHKYEEYKKAKLEFEKIKYLEEEEVAKKIIKMKKDEQKELDEISNLLFKRNKH